MPSTKGVKGEETARTAGLGLTIGAVLVTAAVAVSGAAFGDSPERSGLNTPGPQTVTVTPSANLVDGQVVTVSGANFPPSALVELSQCAVPTGPEAPVCRVLGGPEVQTGPDGSFGPLEGVPVVAQVMAGDPVRVLSCAPPGANCLMVAQTGDPFQTGEPGEASAGHLLFFGGPGPEPPGGGTTTTVGGSVTTTTVGGGVTTTTVGGSVTTTTTADPDEVTTTTAAPGGGGDDNDNSNDNDNANTNANDQTQTNNQSQTGGNNSNTNSNVIDLTNLGSNFDAFHHRGVFSNEHGDHVTPGGHSNTPLARTGSESSRLTGVALLLLLIGCVLVLGTRAVTTATAAVPGSQARRRDRGGGRPGRKSLRAVLSPSRRWR